MLDIKFWPWRHTRYARFRSPGKSPNGALDFWAFQEKEKKNMLISQGQILFGIKWFKLELFRISAPAASQMVLINGLCVRLHWQLSTLASNPGNTQLSLLVTGSNDSGESYMRRRRCAISPPRVSTRCVCAAAAGSPRRIRCLWLVPVIRSVWTGPGGGRKGTSSES